MPVLLSTHYRLAYESFSRNRSRSFLTCLGIGIGIASIILILSLMGSITNLISSQISSAGSNLIIVRPNSEKDTIENIVDELTYSNQYLKSNLTIKDVETIKNLDNVSSASPIARMNATISAERTVNSASIVATNSAFADIQNLVINSGSFLSENTPIPSAAIGKDLSLILFGTSEPVGKTFTLLGEKFLITGVLSKVDDPINFNNVDFDNSLFVDVSDLKKLDDSLQIQQINVKAKTESDLPALSKKIASSLESEKAGDKNFSVSYGDEITHPASSLFSVISGMLTLVAGVSLVVGGIGIMNIMLVSVAERTHEIGIRKSVGASGYNILLQFIFEALILSSLGGLLGLGLGYGLAFLVSIITPFAPYIDWNILGVTLATSVLIGLVFGIYPAVKAALKNPIDSLRYSR